MTLIIGGAYQGKRSFAVNALGIPEEAVFTCSGEELDLSARCIDRIEEYALACVRAGREPVDIFRENRALLEDSILICQDIFCGVVPVDPVLREWRQAVGRLCQYLAAESGRVSRIYCGLEQRLK